MREAFPELQEVRGHVTTAWGKDGHVWLVDPDGAIVDPTAGQYPYVAAYDPWKPGDEVCVGKCMNCGCQIWEAVQSLEGVKRRDTCGAACEREAAEYLADLAASR
jgi:hypothetical protein